jgi:aspartate aminotransferase
MSFDLAARARTLERTLIRRLFESAPPDAINLGLGQPDLPTPESVALAGIAAVAAGKTAYTPTAGLPALRRAIASRYPGFASGPESVVVTCGSQEAMFAAYLALVDPGREVLIPDPGYPAYGPVARLVGAEPVTYRLPAARGFRLDVAEIEARLTPRTALVVLSSPSNPTGVVNRSDELAPLLETLAARRIPWLSDEVYGGFCYEGDFVSPAAIAPRGGVVISSLSKDASMAGWRVGWLAGPAELVERAVAVHQYLVTCSPSLSQEAALAAFDDEGARSRRRYLETFRRRRAIMGQALGSVPGLRFTAPEGAFYYFVDASHHGRSLEVAQRILERQKVIVIPGIAFGTEGEGRLRISFAATEERIVEGIRRIAIELGGRSPGG